MAGEGILRPRLSLVHRQAWPLPARRWFLRLMAALEAEAGPLPRLAIAFLDDRAIGELHRRFLADPSPTDVISFPLDEDEGALAVSVETAAREAARLGVDLAEEVALYIVHGVLHLRGHDDRRPRQRAAMIAAERRVLSRLGMAPRER